MVPHLVIFGLGNPGPTYRNTRHNLGFMVTERAVAACGVTWVEASNHRLARSEWLSTPVTFVQPLTYMNRSGDAVRAVHARLPFAPSEVLVVTDDIALPLGHLRLRPGGSHGGHNGLRSVIEALATSEVPRLRLGVGPVPPGADPADFVLDPFEPSDRPAVDEMIQRGVACVAELIQGGIDRAMSRFNGPPPEPPQTG